MARTTAALHALATNARARRWGGLRAATAIGLPLVIGAAVGHVAEGGQAALGSLVAVYASDAPYRRRAWLLVLIAITLAVAMGLGTLVADSVPLTCVAGGILGVVSALGFLALRVGPPREYFVLLTFLLGTTLPIDPSAAPSRAGLVLAGGVLAWFVGMSPWVFRRPGPERAAVLRAHAAVTQLLRALGGPDEEAAGHDAIVAVRTALDVTDGAASADGLRWSRRVLAAELTLEAALALEVEGTTPLDPAWAAAMDAAARGEEPPPVPAAPGLPAGVRLAEAAEAVRAAWSADAAPAGAAPELDPRWRTPLRWSLRRRSPHLRTALRIGLAVVVGLLVGDALGLDHPSWVAASACAVLQGSSLTVARSRAVHRGVGTAVGVMVAGLIFSLDPSDGVRIVLIIVLQFGIELVIVSSYGLAVAAITPLVLLLIGVSGAGNTVDGLLDVRLVDTLVGCGLAGVIVLLTRPPGRVGHLPEAQAEAIRAAAAVLVPAVTTGTGRADLLPGRRRVHDAILRLRAAESDAVGDALRRDPREDERWPLTSTVDRLARLVLTLPAEGPPAAAVRGAVDPGALRTTLEAYADLLANRGRPAGPPPAPPELPGLPRTTRTLAELRRLLAELGPAAPRSSAGPPRAAATRA
jgi:uncharacterized membrane protein YccC